MSELLSERRLAENQVIFRQNNELVQKNLEKLRKTAIAEGRESLLPDIDMPLHFYCECSDENCRQRIILKPSEYNDLHQNSSQFILLPGHDIAEVERTVKATDKFIVVEKFKTPPKSSGELNKTDLDYTQ
jgi:hypothetical protein